MNRLKNPDNKTLYKLLISIGLPITLQSIMQSILPMIDQVMVGQLGEDNIAALAAGNRTYNIYYFIMIAITGATTIYVVQFWGSDKKSSIPKAFKIPLIIGFITFAVYLFVAFVFPTQSVAIFGVEDNDLLLASQVQKIYAISALPVLFTNLFAVLLRGTQRSKVPMYFGLVSILVNTALNYLFIFGFGFIEPMGILGAAFATLIARTIETIGLIIYILVNKDLSFNIIKVLRAKIDKSFSSAYYKTMYPLLALNLLFVLASTSYSAIYGNMSTDALAASAIMAPVESFTVGLFVGLSTACGIIIGTELGKKEFETAIAYSRRIIKIATFFTLIVSGLVILLAYPYTLMYNVSDAVFHDSVFLVMAAGVFLTIKVLNMIVCNGIIQTGGDTRYLLFLDVIGPWCIGMPMALLGAVVFQFPIYIVYSMITLEEVVRLILGLRKAFKNEWATNIVHDIEI